MTDASRHSTPQSLTADPAARRISDGIWRALDQYRGLLNVTEIGDVLLVLLYLRGSSMWEGLPHATVDAERAIGTGLSAVGEDGWLLRPLLDSVRKADETGQLVPIIELVNRLDPKGDVPLPQVFNAVLDKVSGAATRKGGGDFYTPRAITELAAGLLDPTPNDRILDPCCKAGGFPAAIADRLIRQGNPADRLTVTISDYSIHSCALAYLNLRMRGVTPLVLRGAADRLRTGAPENKYDVVTANPPFNMSTWSGDSGRYGRWRYGTPPAHNSNFAWLQYSIASLNIGGQAAVVMPYGAGLSENTQETGIRAAMLDDGVVSAVIALPGQMFLGTDIPVAVWLLQPPPDHRPDEILFVDGSGLGSVQQRARRALTDADIDKVVETYRDWRDDRLEAVAGFAATVSVEKIRSDGYRLNPRAYVTPIDQSPDFRTRARQVTELTQRLDRLADQAARLDQDIEAYLKELSL